tara:strand:- start:1886 stop:2089 length:204 start_codon:yes stop_codon:yes gene_type:complete
MVNCYVENCEEDAESGVDGKCFFHSEDELEAAEDFFDSLIGVSPAVIEEEKGAENDAPGLDREPHPR